MSKKKQQEESKKRILLVDDEPINLEFFEVMLTKLGFDIKKAVNGSEALETLKRWEPDLIILDNVMPKVSGWEVTRKIRTDEDFKHLADIPIIMFSAMDDVRDKVEGLELGADDYITKPYNFTEVMARIRALLRTRELISQIEHREKRIMLAEESLVKIMEAISDVRTGLASLLVLANGVPDNAQSRQSEGYTHEQVHTLIKQSRSELKKSLSALKSLDASISELREEAHNLKQSETELPAIKSGHRKSFAD